MMTTITKGVQLPHCPMLEELERSAKWCLERVALSRSRDTPPSAKEASTMQDVWNRILKHKGCPDTSSTPENTYKTAMTSIDYFAASEFSTVIDTVASPIDGLADKYMQKNLSAGAYSAYQVGGAFLLADSGPLTERLVGYAQKVSASDPATPPTDKATLNADIEATSSIAVADALDSSSVNVPQTSTSGVNLTSFDNQLNSLTNQLLTLANVLQT